MFPKGEVQGHLDAWLGIGLLNQFDAKLVKMHLR